MKRMYFFKTKEILHWLYTTCNSNIQWSETKTLAIETNYFRRCVRESLEIKRNRTGPTDRYGINQDNGLYVKTNTWDSLLYHQKIVVPTK